MKRRPAGVIFSSILLGIAAALLLLMAAGTVVSALFLHHLPASAATMPGGAPHVAAWVTGITLGMAIVYLALAAWAITTLVGLVRLRPWARISIMIIGGGTAAIGLLTALLFFVMPALMARLPTTPPAPNPALLKAVFLGMGLVWLVIAAIGIYWIVYYSLRRTREAFRPPLQPILPGAYPTAYVAPPLPHPSSLDYTEAQPVNPQPPLYASPDSPNFPPTPVIPHSGRPISITILAIFFLFGILGFLPTLLLHTPLLILGFLITASASRVILLVMALWVLITGIGLLTRFKPAWYMAMAYCLLGVLNMVAMLLPGGLARMSEYMHTINNTFSPGLQPAFDPFAPPFFKLIILPGMILGVALMIFVIILLWRARWYFGLAPTPGE